MHRLERAPLIALALLLAAAAAVPGACGGAAPAVENVVSSESTQAVSTTTTTVLELGLDDLIAEVDTPYPDGDARYTSSNPYDYLKDNDYYDAIVAMGYDALPGLEEYLLTENENGLREYLLCVAIEDITACDLKQFDASTWATASEFLEKWSAYLVGMPDRVDKILSSASPPAQQQKDIAKLGAPAVPYVVEQAAAVDKEDGAGMADTLRAILEKGKPGSTIEGKTVTELANLNSDLIEQLQTYIENR